MYNMNKCKTFRLSIHIAIYGPYNFDIYLYTTFKNYSKTIYFNSIFHNSFHEFSTFTIIIHTCYNNILLINVISVSIRFILWLLLSIYGIKRFFLHFTLDINSQIIIFSFFRTARFTDSELMLLRIRNLSFQAL